MPFTHRFLAFLSPVALLIGLSHWWPVSSVLAALYAVVMVGVLLKDLRSIAQEHELLVERGPTSALSVATANELYVKVRNRGRFQLLGTVRESFPLTFKVDREDFELALRPQDEQVLRFSVTPTRRGTFKMGPLYLRARGSLGLAEITRQIASEHTLEVIPDLLATQKYDLLLRKGLLRQTGTRTLKILGRGDEFESLRHYTEDDDPRHIDWKASAKRGDLMTKQFQPETKQRIIIGLDLGRLMLGRSGELAKIDAVLNASLLLAHAAINKGDSVGMIAFAEELIARLPTGAGRRQTRLLLRQIAALEARTTETDYRIFSHELSVVERKRALVVLFTDFLDESQLDELYENLLMLRRRHRILLVAVRDSETFQLAHAAPSSDREAFASAAASHLLTHRRAAIRRIQRSGVLVADLGQEELSFAVVQTYLRLREQAAF